MKIFKSAFIYLIFIGLTLQAGYLYSILWDFVPWGSSSRDGLFFLFFYIAVLPLLIITSIVKWFLFKKQQSLFLKGSFFLYSTLVGLPAIDTYGSQISLGIGVTICTIVCICIVIEVIKYRKQIFYRLNSHPDEPK
jgi:hypothetical protein